MQSELKFFGTNEDCDASIELSSENTRNLKTLEYTFLEIHIIQFLSKRITNIKCCHVLQILTKIYYNFYYLLCNLLNSNTCKPM